MLEDKEAEVAFNSLVSITVGDGANTFFWRDIWLRGALVSDIAPLVCDLVSNNCAKKRTVKEALLNHKWISDIRGNLSSEGLVQCLALLATVCTLRCGAARPLRLAVVKIRPVYGTIHLQSSMLGCRTNGGGSRNLA
jgi:hypothetical protein